MVRGGLFGVPNRMKELPLMIEHVTMSRLLLHLFKNLLSLSVMATGIHQFTLIGICCVTNRVIIIIKKLVILLNDLVFRSLR